MKVAAVLILAGLLGCASTTPAEIRKLQPEIGFTDASVDDVVRCFAGIGNGYISITSLPSSRSAEIEVKVTPVAQTMSLYLTTVTPNREGARLETRYSGTTQVAISESNFRKMLATCAPPR